MGTSAHLVMGCASSSDLVLQVILPNRCNDNNDNNWNSNNHSIGGGWWLVEPVLPHGHQDYLRWQGAYL